jgi:hypothetical protein
LKHEPPNDRFLETLINNRASWKNEKELAKIVNKMQRGKSLKKKEFAKVHWVLWEIGHHRY